MNDQDIVNCFIRLAQLIRNHQKSKDKMFVYTPPEPVPTTINLFLAGGISDCPDWQSHVIALLRNTPGNIANPRRDGSFDKTGTQAMTQIAWEYETLKAAVNILFWFPKESVCPIALFELGAHLDTEQQLIIGADPAYPRCFDLEQQLPLAKPGITLYSTLEETVEAAQNLIVFNILR